MFSGFSTTKSDSTSWGFFFLLCFNLALRAGHCCEVCCTSSSVRVELVSSQGRQTFQKGISDKHQETCLIEPPDLLQSDGIRSFQDQSISPHHQCWSCTGSSFMRPSSKIDMTSVMKRSSLWKAREMGVITSNTSSKKCKPSTNLNCFIFFQP